MNYSILDSVDKSIIIEKNHRHHQDNACHIAYGSDENYQCGTAISIVSVLENNKNNNFIFHIFTDVCSSDYQNKLSEIAEHYSSCINIHLVDPTIFSKLPSNEVWSHAMYYRLLAYEFLNDRCNRALYLDADVVCAGDISELFSLDFGECIAAVVEDVPSTKSKSLERLAGFVKGIEHYFNSGVMLVNIEKWNEYNLTKKSFELLQSDCLKSIKYPDQDVLNILLNGKAIYLERKYNTIYTLKSELKDKTHKAYLEKITKYTVLIHYTGITKPWHSWANYPSAQAFMNAWCSSPWKYEPMLSAEKLPEMQERYKHLFARKKYISSIIALVIYRLKKITKIYCK